MFLKKKKDVFISELSRSSWKYFCTFLSKNSQVAFKEVPVCCYYDSAFFFFKFLVVSVIHVFQLALKCLGLVTTSLVLIKLSVILVGCVFGSCLIQGFFFQ